MKFIGRHREQDKLNALLQAPEQNAALIYGRRRVGKSELILECFRRAGIRTIYYECRQTTTADNTRALAEVISETFNLPRLAFDSIEDALRFAFERSTTERIALAIDEYSYLRQVSPGIDSIIQVLLDTYRNTSHLTLILCGSFVEIMKSLMEKENPLYGRFDVKLNVQPMDYLDSAHFYPSFSPEDKARLYSVFGGIPYYNKLVDERQDVRGNIIRLITEPGARLEDEVPAYLLSEISKITNANEVFGALADGYSRYKDILSQSHVSSGPTLVNVLNKLVTMELVQRKAPINDPLNKKKTSYVICDNLSAFYYRYVFRFLSQRNSLDPEVFYDRFVHDDFEHRHVPLVFEEICRQYLVRLNRTGIIDPAFNRIGSYYYDDPATKTNGAFDVVTEDPNGYVFYKAKFRSTPITQQMVDEEIARVRRTGLRCYKYGFFSRAGFTAMPDEQTEFTTLDEIYELM